jgi:3-phosphoshikimate 1-carboxyvinyltransferase
MNPCAHLSLNLMSKGTHISPHYASIQGTLVVPGDKSISHRSVILGSLAKGVTSIKGFLKSEDSLNTLKCFEQMGINYTWKDAHTLQIEGKGLQGLTAWCLICFTDICP